MKEIENALTLLSNPYCIVGIILIIILLWSLYFIGKKYPQE